MPDRRAMSSRLAAAPSRVKTSLATSTMRSRLRFASARGLRAGGGGVSFLFGIPAVAKSFATGEYPRLSIKVGTVSVLFAGEPDVNLRDLPGSPHHDRRMANARICDGSNGFHRNGTGKGADCGRASCAWPYAQRRWRGAAEGGGRR